MGEALEIAKVMVQPTMKLLEMCGNAIGTMYQPRHMRKMTDAEVYRIKQLGNAIIETDGLPIAYDNGEISMNTFNLEDFAKRAELRANYQILREQKNIENIVGKAYQELLDAPKVASDPVDEDWTTRFFNIAKEISSEEMQHIWSKILAGEVSNPGSFSMRTLQTIRNLSQTEATTFQKIIPLVMFYGGQCFVASDEKLLQEYDVYYADLLSLQECGLVNLDLSNNPKVSNTRNSFLFSNTLFMQFWGYTCEETRISFGVHTLARAGKELYSILSHTSNKAYAVKWAESIFNRNRNVVKINLYDVQSVSDNVVNHNVEPFKVLQK